MSRVGVGDVVAGVFVVAVIMVLVRPQSKAGQAVDAISGALVAIVRRATDI